MIQVKNKQIFFPQQKTKHLSLKAVHLSLEYTPPEILSSVQELFSRRKLRKASALLSQAFEKNPHDVLLRIFYGELLLMQKKSPLYLFNGKRDLSLCYPEEKSFPFPVYVAFLALMGGLALLENNLDAAEEYHYLIVALAPTSSKAALLQKQIRKRRKKTLASLVRKWLRW